MANDPKRPQRPLHDEDHLVDETSEDSFPASDPPSWSVIDRTGKPQRQKPNRPQEHPR